jgi:hypothetical protein
MTDPTTCITYNKEQPICSPNENSTWYLGTQNLVTWYMFNSIYLPYDSLNLYFYYKKDYFYYKTINFTNIGTNRGFYPIYIDNKWFPINCTEKDIKWNYTVLLIGNKLNADIIINDTFSQWKPVNFNIIQNASSNCFNNNYNITNDNNTNSKSNQEIKFDTWKIIIIVVLIIMAIIISIFIFYIRKKIFIFFKKENKHNISNEKISYNKNVSFQKPNEINKYEKPNSY